MMDECCCSYRDYDAVESLTLWFVIGHDRSFGATFDCYSLWIAGECSHCCEPMSEETINTFNDGMAAWFYGRYPDAELYQVGD